VPESLKNVVLVMHSSNILLPPTVSEDTRSPAEKMLWEKTDERISRFLGADFMSVVLPVLSSEPVSENAVTKAAA
jgi:brefeldin A-resistance guanine nucleotide exchange factor 1